MALETVGHTSIEAPGRRQPPKIPLVSVGQLGPLTGFLDEIGAPVSRLLSRSHIPQALFEDSRALLPLHLVDRFLEVVASSEAIANLGAVVGERTTAFDLPILGPALQQAVTVRDYLQRGIELIGEVQPGERFWLTLESDQVRFHQVLPGPLSAGRYHADLYALVVTIGMLGRFADDKWHPREVCVLATDQCFIGDSSAFGDAEIRLAQPHSSFTIPIDLLTRRISPAARRAGKALGPQGPMRRSVPQDFLTSIETLVIDFLKAEALQLHAVAEAAGVSTRTLQRQLASLGMTYSALVARARRSLADEMLLQTQLPVREIAATLSYTDPANFTRAFRRAAGMSPRAYRIMCRASAGRACRGRAS